LGTDDLAVTVCSQCGIALVKDNAYLIPIQNVETSQIEEHPQDEAAELLRDPEHYIPVPDTAESFDVLIDGERNGLETGKKIREKNEQLKKKVAGYEREQRSVRADVERQISQKQARGQILKS
jgi:hypothetical protein